MSAEMLPHIERCYMMGNVEVAGAKLRVIFKFYQKLELPTKLHFFGLRREEKKVWNMLNMPFSSK